MKLDRLILKKIITRRMVYRQRNVRQFLQSAYGTLFVYLTRVTYSRYVVAFRRFAGTAGIWLRQESLRHILASPGYAPGTIAVNLHESKEDSLLVKRIAAYPCIFNRFSVIHQPVNSNVRHFSAF